jgi:hypothetical protein
MLLQERESLFRDLVRLRHVERSSPDNRDIGAVRLHLEELVGATVKPSFAARVLDVTPAALRRWIDRKEVALVIGRDGRKYVPVPFLVDLAEAVERSRASGRHHVLEAAVLEAREQAEKVPRIVFEVGEGDAPDHRGDRRSFAYHRAIARRVNRRMADMALVLVRHWREEGSIDPRYADAWEEILLKPVPDIRKRLEDDSDETRDLRQNSPFAGILSEAERQAIFEGVG